jgi:hypothetical protein
MVEIEESLKLTYRELAEQLGISVTAARSRVRRAKQRGRWRVIPRNHPNTPAQIEIPPQDIVFLAERGPSTAGTATVRTPTNFDDADYFDTLSTLNQAYRYILEVNDRLQNSQLDTIALKERLAASEAARQHLLRRVSELEQRCRQQDQRLTEGALEKLKSAVTISRLSATGEERDTYITRLEAGVRSLQAKLRRANRPVWKKVLGLKP